MSTPIRVGVAGLGAVAQVVHLPLLRRRPDLFDIVAVAEISPSTRDRVGAACLVPAGRRHPDLTAMLEAGGLDAVLILTSGSHGAATLDAVRNGIPVFCEKPIAFTQAEVVAIIAACEGRPLVQVGYMKQYDPAGAELGRIVAAATGVRAVDVEVLHPSDTSQLAFAHLPTRVDDVDPGVAAELTAATASAVRAAIGRAGDDSARLYTDILLGSIVHDTSLLRGIFGAPRTIDTVRRWAGHPGSVEITGTVAPEVPFSIRWHYLADYPAYRETVTIHHATGSAQAVFPCPYLMNAPSELRVTANDGGRESVTVTRTVAEEFEIELEAFHAMVTRRVRPVSGPEEGLIDVQTAQRMFAVHAATAGLELGGEAAA